MEGATWRFVGGPESVAYRLLDRLRIGLNARLTTWLVASTGLASRVGAARVLEAGSGPASGSSSLRSSLGSGVVALDMDPAGLGEARARDPGLAVVAGDITALPFADDTFDLVWNSSTLEHLHDPRRALAEMARTTAPGGHVFVGVPAALGPLAVQASIRSTRLGVWLGDVWTRRTLGALMTASGLRPVASLRYFLLAFVGVLARKNGRTGGGNGSSS